MKKALILTSGRETHLGAAGAVLADVLELFRKMRVTVTSDESVLASEEIKRYDFVVICAEGVELNKREEKGLCDFVAKGGGIIALLPASVSFPKNREYRKILGCRLLQQRPAAEFTVSVSVADHDITRRVRDFSVRDTLYLVECDSSVEPHLLHTFWHGRSFPLLWTKRHGKGRLVYLGLGQTTDTLRREDVQKLLTRSADWVLGVEENAPVRVAILGYGPAFNMGKHHAGMINQTPGLRLTAVCDKDASRVKAAKGDFEWIRTFSNVKNLAQDPDVDLIIVVTPHNTHCSLALTCLRGGKHVVVEKPFCITTREATAMIEESRRHNVTLTAFHNRRLDGDFLAIKDAVESGMIGEVFHIEAYSGGYRPPRAWWRSDKKVSGGAMYDWGAHFIDWILNLMPGKVENVVGFSHKRVWHQVTNEDQCQAIMRFEGGRYAEYQTSTIARVGKPKWRILGTQGAIVPGREKEINVTTEMLGDETTFPVKHKEMSWAGYYWNIADHLLRGDPLLVTPESARRVIAVIEAAERSAKTGKAVKPAFP